MSIKLVWRGGNSTDTRRIALASSNYNMLQDLVCEKFHVGIQDFTLRFGAWILTDSKNFILPTYAYIVRVLRKLRKIALGRRSAAPV